MELALFDEVAEVLRGLVADEFGAPRHRARRYGVKVWFGADHPIPEHYEAQVIGPEGVEGAAVLALEVGFHAEHRRVADNEAVLARLLGSEGRWRAVVGDDAVAGPFLGRPDVWRRVSETWPDPDLGADDLAVDLGLRLADYVRALEPVRRGAP